MTTTAPKTTIPPVPVVVETPKVEVLKQEVVAHAPTPVTQPQPQHKPVSLKISKPRSKVKAKAAKGTNVKELPKADTAKVKTATKAPVKEPVLPRLTTIESVKIALAKMTPGTIQIFTRKINAERTVLIKTREAAQARIEELAHYDLFITAEQNKRTRCKLFTSKRTK